MDNYDAFNRGKAPKVRYNRYDSEAEETISTILYSIWKDYAMYSNMGIVMSSQQPLDNYIEVPHERYNEIIERRYENKHKWMKFDFIFENVYVKNGVVNYVPIAVVECDGEKYHNTAEQRELDRYKDGVAENIGAPMLRIKYNELDIQGKYWSSLPSFEQKKARFIEVYEDELLNNIIRGKLTPTRDFRKDIEFSKLEYAQKQAQWILKNYERFSKWGQENMRIYGEIGRRVQFIMELERQKSNIYKK